MQKKIHQDVFIGIVFILVSTLLYIRTFDFNVDEVAMFPRGLIFLMDLFALFIIIKGVQKTKKLRQGEELKYEGDEAPITAKLLKSPFITLAFVLVYISLLNILGFFPATVLFLASYLWYKKVKDWKIYAYLIVGVNIFIYALFVLQLKVQLPLGIFFE